MDSWVTLLLISFFGSFVLLIPLAIYFDGRKKRRRWSEIAARLGMQGGGARKGLAALLDPLEPIRGERGGVSICVLQVPGGSGDQQSSSSSPSCTRVECLMPTPLGVGMYARVCDGIEMTMSRFLGEMDRSISLRDLGIDAEIIASGTDPEAARILVSTPPVREAIGWSCSTSFAVYISDGEVRLTRRGQTFDFDTVRRAVDIGAEIVRRLTEARAAMGATPLERRIEAAFEHAAQELRLELRADGRAVRGRVAGMHVEAADNWTARGHQTAFSVRYDRSLGVGLRLVRHQFGEGVERLFGNEIQDIEVGHPALDRTFRVQGTDAAAVRALLTPNACDGIMRLAQHSSELVVSDDCLRAVLGHPVVDSAQLVQNLHVIASVGAALARAAPGPGGPPRAV